MLNGEWRWAARGEEDMEGWVVVGIGGGGLGSEAMRQESSCKEGRGGANIVHCIIGFMDTPYNLNHRFLNMR